jgi:hypothetical protein
VTITNAWATATTVEVGEPGPLTQLVLDYTQLLGTLASGDRPSGWVPLEPFVHRDTFERVGTFLEQQTWEQYTDMLTQWASTIDRFVSTLRRVAEIGDTVYYEIEERHHRGERVNVVNSLTVFRFRDARIDRLDVFLQQAR